MSSISITCLLERGEYRCWQQTVDLGVGRASSRQAQKSPCLSWFLKNHLLLSCCCRSAGRSLWICISLFRLFLVTFLLPSLSGRIHHSLSIPRPISLTTMSGNDRFDQEAERASSTSRVTISRSSFYISMGQPTCRRRNFAQDL